MVVVVVVVVGGREISCGKKGEARAREDVLGEQWEMRDEGNWTSVTLAFILSIC
jgi:hypothetical protein